MPAGVGSRRGRELQIFGEQVVIGRDALVLRRAVVWMKDGRIVDVQSETEPPAAALRYRTVVPGLVDPHVHLLCSAADGLVTPADALAEDRAVRGALLTCGRLLRHGITTVRDLGSPREPYRRLRRELAKAGPAVPRLLAASRPVTVPGGHLAEFGLTVTTADEARGAVAACAEDGADVIKVIVTGGKLTPGTQMGRISLEPSLLEAVVDAARRAGLPVAAHVHGTEGVVAAVDAGVDTLEHCSWTDHSGRIRRPIRSVLDRARANGQVVVTAGPLPPVLSGQLLCQPPGGSGDIDGANLREADEWLAGRRARRQLALWRNAGLARAAGVPVAVGTDSLFGVFPDDSDLLARAHLLVDAAGWRPLDVLESLTGAAGRACRPGGGLGTIEAGAISDVVGLDGDPLADIDDLRRVSLVVRDGQVVYEGPTDPRQSRTYEPGDRATEEAAG